MIDNFSDIDHIKLNISFYAKYTETVIISTIYYFILVISRRVVFSLVLTISIFTGFISICLTKIHYLYEPLFPTDLSQFTEFYQSKHIFTQIVPGFLLLFVCFIVLNFILYKKDKPITIKKFWIFRISLLCFFISTVYINNDSLQQHLRNKGVFYKKNSNMVVHYLTKGMATSFLQIAAFHDEYPRPKNYSRNEIERIIDAYNLNNKTEQVEPVNVIFLMVESLTNPYYFGWETTEPSMLALNSINVEKSVLSPVYGGKSINAEFELLTGLSTQFAMPETLLYREVIKQPIPSIASYLSQKGYFTMAMRDEPIDKYGFRKIYQWLGFESQFSFTNLEDTKDPTSKYKSSIVIAKKIIDVVEKNHPAFVFTFTMSSHAPWDGRDYESELDFIYPETITSSEKNRMKGYLNAINHMDKGFQILIDHFSNSENKTLILITGDHQPHLNNYNQFLSPEHEAESVNTFYKKHKLPLYLWKNFDSNIQVNNSEISMNLLSGYVLGLIDSKPCGIMKLNQILHSNYSVVGKVTKSKNQTIIESQSELMSDFESVQYDLLYGNNYLGELLSDQCHTPTKMQ